MHGKTIINTKLTVEELEEKYLSCLDPREKTHWQIIWLVAQGKTATYAAKVTGLTNSWISTLIKRFNEKGDSGIIDHRHTNPGGKFTLSNDQKNKLKELLNYKSPDGGLWNTRKVRNWIEEEVGHIVGNAVGHRYLKYLDFTLQSLRPKHLKSATEEEKEEFKKNFMKKWMKSERRILKQNVNSGHLMNIESD